MTHTERVAQTAGRRLGHGLVQEKVNPASATARQYLEKHSTYPEALKALLQDLAVAHVANDQDQESILCDALNELRVNQGSTPRVNRTDWAAGRPPKRA